MNELARLGLGIALLPASYLREEGLVRVLPRWSSVGIPVHALHAGKKFSPAKVRVFLDALAAWKNATWQ